MKPCMTPGCELPPHAWGVCVTCYRRYSRAVERGDTSWRELNRDGKIDKAAAEIKRKGSAAQRALERRRKR